MKVRELPYVAHDCKNPKCRRRWLAPDTSNVTSIPPRNKYCPDCELFEGLENTKDPARVARGRALAEAQKRKREQDAWLEEL